MNYNKYLSKIKNLIGGDIDFSIDNWKIKMETLYGKPLDELLETQSPLSDFIESKLTARESLDFLQEEDYFATNCQVAVKFLESIHYPLQNPFETPIVIKDIAETYGFFDWNPLDIIDTQGNRSAKVTSIPQVVKIGVGGVLGYSFGLHEASEGNEIISLDLTSAYPTLIAHCEPRLSQYIIDLIVQKETTSNKSEKEGIKLILNNMYGAMCKRENPVNMRVARLAVLHCQFIILRMIRILCEENNFKFIHCHTDGLVIQGSLSRFEALKETLTQYPFKYHQLKKFFCRDQSNRIWVDMLGNVEGKGNLLRTIYRIDKDSQPRAMNTIKKVVYALVNEKLPELDSKDNWFMNSDGKILHTIDEIKAFDDLRSKVMDRGDAYIVEQLKGNKRFFKCLREYLNKIPQGDSLDYYFYDGKIIIEDKDGNLGYFLINSMSQWNFEFYGEEKPIWVSYINIFPFMFSLDETLNAINRYSCCATIVNNGTGGGKTYSCAMIAFMKLLEWFTNDITTATENILYATNSNDGIYQFEQELHKIFNARKDTLTKEFIEFFESGTNIIVVNRHKSVRNDSWVGKIIITNFWWIKQNNFWSFEKLIPRGLMSSSHFLCDEAGSFFQNLSVSIPLSVRMIPGVTGSGTGCPARCRAGGYKGQYMDKTEASILCSKCVLEKRMIVTDDGPTNCFKNAVVAQTMFTSDKVKSINLADNIVKGTSDFSFYESEVTKITAHPIKVNTPTQIEITDGLEDIVDGINNFVRCLYRGSVLKCETQGYIEEEVGAKTVRLPHYGCGVELLEGFDTRALRYLACAKNVSFYSATYGPLDVGLVESAYKTVTIQNKSRKDLDEGVQRVMKTLKVTYIPQLTKDIKFRNDNLERLASDSQRLIILATASDSDIRNKKKREEFSKYSPFGIIDSEGDLGLTKMLDPSLGVKTKSASSGLFVMHPQNGPLIGKNLFNLDVLYFDFNLHRPITSYGTSTQDYETNTIQHKVAVFKQAFGRFLRKKDSEIVKCREVVLFNISDEEINIVNALLDNTSDLYYNMWETKETIVAKPNFLASIQIPQLPYIEENVSHLLEMVFNGTYSNSYEWCQGVLPSTIKKYKWFLELTTQQQDSILKQLDSLSDSLILEKLKVYCDPQVTRDEKKVIGRWFKRNKNINHQGILDLAREYKVI